MGAHVQYKSAKRQATEQILNNFSDCHRQSCRLRIPGAEGSEECLMESVRSHWAKPNEINYCKDPICKKFVDQINQKLESE